MTKYLLPLLFLPLLFSGCKPSNATSQEVTKKTKPSIHSLAFTDINGDTVKLSAYKGKKLMLVNTASKCGFTPQYEQLQSMHEQYGDKLVVIGFPCNQFGNQEPGTEDEIATFCKVNFGVNFQLSQKMDVKGKNQHPIYAWLTQKTQNGVEDSAVKWNFHKYLIDENGHYLATFPSNVKPNNSKIISIIEDK